MKMVIDKATVTCMYIYICLYMKRGEILNKIERGRMMCMHEEEAFF